MNDDRNVIDITASEIIESNGEQACQPAEICERTATANSQAQASQQSLNENAVLVLKEQSLLPRWEYLDMRKVFSGPPPPQEWVFKNLFPKGIVGALVSEGGCGKTYFCLTLALSLAMGKPILQAFEPDGEQKVLMLLGEDSTNIVHERVLAISRQAKLTRDDIDRICKNLFFVIDQPGFLVQETREGLLPTPNLQRLFNAIDRFQPDLLIIDPKAQYDGTNENSNAHATFFVNLIKRAISRSKGSALITHHERKKDPRGDDGPMSSDTARGATGFRDASRWVGQLRMPSPKKVKEVLKLNKKPTLEECRPFVEFDVTKNNYAPRIERSIVLKRGLGGALRDLSRFEPGGWGSRSLDIVYELCIYLNETGQSLTARELERGDRGKSFRSLPALEGVSRDQIRAALDLGVEKGILIVKEEPRPLGGSPRQIYVPAGKRDGEPDATPASN
ncbi:MAG TPA: AAA family ATPase [Candidatus Hydrogenedentes bacterium]|nr:AAA family ATPase [Candidatus Hydrogenedentota bacterium]